MPFYYATNVQTQTNGSAGTETDHLRALTVTNQGIVRVMAIYGAARFGTAGGAILRLKSFQTPSSAGSSKTPTKRNPAAPVASSTWFTGPTVGSIVKEHMSIGVAQTGGTGGWMALEPDHALAMEPGGGEDGNCDVYSIANAASVNVDFTVEFSE